MQPGDFVAIVGFASPEYLVVDLACAYLGLVSVPLQHNAAVSRLAPILAETEPRVLAVSAQYLNLAVESALDITSLRHLVVFDYQPGVDDHRDGMRRAHELLRAAGRSVTIHTIGEIVARGAQLPPVPIYTAGSDDRLAMILYTSGSTGTPNGAMYTERMVAGTWTSSFATDADAPVFNVDFLPLNHLGGRLPLTSSFQVGGVSYFVPESDMPTLFEDWALVRPTELGLVPRVVDMLFHRYRSVVDQRVADGLNEGEAEESAAVEIRETVLGGRGLAAWVATAPLAGDMRVFSGIRTGPARPRRLRADGGRRRAQGRRRDTSAGHLLQLVDVPVLGYFLTDKPYPRGELLISTTGATPGYYKRPDVTAGSPG